MNVPRYWARSASGIAASGGRPIPTWCWRWSNASIEEAQQKADARAIELARLLEAGTPPDHFAYGEQPLREEIVQRIGDDRAIVTRNLYGALVLNALRAPPASHALPLAERGRRIPLPPLAIRVRPPHPQLRRLHVHRASGTGERSLRSQPADRTARSIRLRAHGSAPGLKTSSR